MTVEPFRAANRKLSSWIAGFLEYTEGINSPEIFRRWSAIAAIAGVCERKVFIRSEGSWIYPNLYVILCGPPGVGKSRAFHTCERLWRKLTPGHHVAPVNVTKPALMDQLFGAHRQVHQLENYGVPTEFHSLLVAVGELSALLPNYDSEFMNALTYLYDGEHYEERRRSSKQELDIERPLITLLAGTTPGFLADMLPVGAWNQGFLARTFIVFSDVLLRSKLSLDAEREHDFNLYNCLIDDIKEIGAMVARLTFTPGARAQLSAWHEQGHHNTPPDHPRLQHYNTRRLVHMLKLCMIAAVDRGVDVIGEYDVQSAYNWLEEVEGAMPNIFKAMTSGGDAQVIQECNHFVRTEFVRSGKPLDKTRVYLFLQQRLAVNSVDRAYDLMKRSNMIIETPMGIIPTESGANH